MSKPHIVEFGSKKIVCVPKEWDVQQIHEWGQSKAGTAFDMQFTVEKILSRTPCLKCPKEGFEHVEIKEIPRPKQGGG